MIQSLAVHYPREFAWTIILVFVVAVLLVVFGPEPDGINRREEACSSMPQRFL